MGNIKEGYHIVKRVWWENWSGGILDSTIQYTSCVCKICIWLHFILATGDKKIECRVPQKPSIKFLLFSPKNHGDIHANISVGVMDISIYAPFSPLLKVSITHFYYVYSYWTLLRTTIYLKDQTPQALHVKYTFIFRYLARECWEHQFSYLAGHV